MIVTIGLAIVAARTIAKSDFVNEAGLLQVAQRVVNGCVADTGQALPGRLENVAGGRVVVSLLYDLENRLSLRRQLWFLLGCLQDGFRLILNYGFVNRGSGVANDGMFVCEIDDAVDVAFKRWTLDSMRREEFLSLARVVELPDKEVRNSVMRQACNPR